MTAVHFIVSVIEGVMAFVFSGAFLRRDKGTEIRLPVLSGIIISGSQLALTAIDAPAAGVMLLSAALLYIFMKLYYSVNNAKTLLAFVSYCFVLFICDLIAYTPFTFSEGAPAARSFDRHYPNAAVTVAASRVILVLICITVRQLVRRRHSSYAQLGVAVSLTATGVIFLLFAVFFTDLSPEGNYDRAPLTYFFILLLLVIAGIYAGIASFLNARERRKRFQLARQQNRMLERSLHEQENTFALWRKSVHDYKNTVLALDAMLENGELDKLRAYIDQEKQSFMHRAEYIRSGSGVVDTVLNTKYAAALDKGITFTVNASMPSKCGISDVHLASVIGNLLDNALEASDHEEDPFIDIMIAEVQGFLMIKIINKCSSPPETSVTSKPDSIHHGIGLQSVRAAVSDYDGQFDLSFESGKATAAVMLPIN